MQGFPFLSGWALAGPLSVQAAFRFGSISSTPPLPSTTSSSSSWWSPKLPSNPSTTLQSASKVNNNSPNTASSSVASMPRIGIIGGGITGITAAHALVHRLKSASQPCEIVVFEGDPHGPHKSYETERRDKIAHELQILQTNVTDTTALLPIVSPATVERPAWEAATARNANSLVPAAAMHVFSRKSVLWQVFADTVQDLVWQWRQQQQRRHDGDEDITIFDQPPPYFNAHLWRCVGPSATVAERWSFVHFVRNYLYTTLWLGDAAADDRGKSLVQLARSNRAAYLEALEDAASSASSSSPSSSSGTVELKAQTGHSQGFLSLHRTSQKAMDAVREAHEHGEEAELLDWEDALKWEPHLHNLPIQPLYAVRRPNDYTSSCETFIRRWTRLLVERNAIDIRKGMVESVHHQPQEATYRVCLADGDRYECDYLVLAAGGRTALFAAQLGVAAACPTYPLRGYSLTIFTPPQRFWEIQQGKNLLHQPFSVDSVYCSSISPWMARLAGFGELVGYPDKARHVPSLAPNILVRYAQQIFPEAMAFAADEASQGYRPLSPDDVPLVGEVPGKPGLFLHTGHGTLGWTMGLATGDCLAQALKDRLEGRDPSAATNFELMDGTTLERRILSPSRFIK